MSLPVEGIASIGFVDASGGFEVVVAGMTDIRIVSARTLTEWNASIAYDRDGVASGCTVSSSTASARKMVGITVTDEHGHYASGAVVTGCGWVDVTNSRGEAVVMVPPDTDCKIHIRCTEFDPDDVVVAPEAQHLYQIRGGPIGSSVTVDRDMRLALIALPSDSDERGAAAVISDELSARAHWERRGWCWFDPTDPFTPSPR